MRIDAALVVVRDLTEHAMASEALQRAQAELAHVTRITTLGELAASIAHEVNQPLAAMVADAQASIDAFHVSDAEDHRPRLHPGIAQEVAANATRRLWCRFEKGS